MGSENGPKLKEAILLHAELCVQVGWVRYIHIIVDLSMKAKVLKFWHSFDQSQIKKWLKFLLKETNLNWPPLSLSPF